MESILSTIWGIIFFALIVGVFLSMKYSNKFFSVLRTLHPEKWGQIKDEGIIFGEIKTQFKLFRFLFDKEYEKFDEQEIIEQGAKLRLLLMVYIPTFIFFFGLTIFLALK